MMRAQARSVKIQLVRTAANPKQTMETVSGFPITWDRIAKSLVKCADLVSQTETLHAFCKLIPANRNLLNAKQN